MPTGTPAPATAAHPERLQRRFTFAEVRPPPEAVALAVGYPAGGVPDVLHEAIDLVLAQGEALWSIEGGCFLYQDVTTDRAAQVVHADGRAFHTGKIVTGQLSRSTALGVFLCTAGKGIEELSRSLLAQGDPFTGYVANSMGSLVVEAAMDRLQEAFGAWMAERGLRVTNRYSPGYCGWHVSEQQHLFRLLPDGYCGVRLTDTSLMQPVKSVSGFIGVGERVRNNDYTCSVCDVDACIYRDVRNRKAAAAAGGACGPTPTGD
jgi:hypothetical protein